MKSKTQTRNESEGWEGEYISVLFSCTTGRSESAARREGIALEHGRQDPKNSEPCLQRAKPEETLVEARSDTDVQIVRLMWVKGRKTNRTVE